MPAVVWGLAGVTGKMGFDDLMEKAYSSPGSDTHFLSDRVTLPGHDGSPYNGDIIRKSRLITVESPSKCIRQGTGSLPCPSYIGIPLGSQQCCVCLVNTCIDQWTMLELHVLASYRVKAGRATYRHIPMTR